MKRVTLAILTLAVATAAVAAVAAAPPPIAEGESTIEPAAGPGMPGAWRRGFHGRFGHRMGGPLARLLHGDDRLATELKLTAAQKRQLVEIGDAQRRKAIDTRAEMERARLDLETLMREDGPDRARVDQAIDRLARLRGEQMKAAFGVRLEARRILTAEQRRQLEQMPHGPGLGRDGGWRDGREPDRGRDGGTLRGGARGRGSRS
jgi:Spy/CpxP family protein refolding chaperone